MHRNTYLLVSILAVCAALLVGMNVGKGMQKLVPVAPVPTPIPTPVINVAPQTYRDIFCGFSIEYPAGYTVLENASGSAILNNMTDKTQSITLTCQKGIPRPAVSADKIETLSIPAESGASVSAKLYHDSSARDGVPMDAVIFRHPANGMDGFIAGYGEAFNAAVKTIRILP